MTTYPLFKVHIDINAALSNIKDVFMSGFINEGTQVSELTRAMQERFGTQQLVLVNSCTSALTLALRLSGVRHYDEVVSTPMTCVATNCPIVTAGADILWADIDPETGCIDCGSVERCLSENPATKAVIAVAWAGNPPELPDLRSLCHARGAKMILDAAHAFGAKYVGHDVSRFADYTCYSFQAIKHFTTGDGGMLICNDERDWKLVKQLKWFGIDRDAAKDEHGDWKGQHWDFDIVSAGYKFNMNNVAAAIGLSQLPHIVSILKAHRDNAEKYTGLLKASKFLCPLRVTSGSEPSYWVYTVLLREEHKRIRDTLLQRLNAEGIMAGLVHVPNDAYACFKSYQRHLPGTQSFFERQLSLPVGWWLNSSDIEHIAKRTEEICSELAQT